MGSCDSDGGQTFNLTYFYDYQSKFLCSKILFNEGHAQNSIGGKDFQPIAVKTLYINGVKAFYINGVKAFYINGVKAFHLLEGLHFIIIYGRYLIWWRESIFLVAGI